MSFDFAYIYDIIVHTNINVQIYVFYMCTHMSLLYKSESSHLKQGCLMGLNDVFLMTDSWMGNIPPIIISPGAVAAWTLCSCCSDVHPASRLVRKSMIWTWIHKKICAMLEVSSLSPLIPSLLHASVIICLQQSDTLSFQYHGGEKALPCNSQILPSSPPHFFVSDGKVSHSKLGSINDDSCCGVTNITLLSKNVFHTLLRIWKIGRSVRELLDVYVLCSWQVKRRAWIKDKRPLTSWINFFWTRPSEFK